MLTNQPNICNQNSEFFPTKAIDFFEKNATSGTKSFVSKTTFCQLKCWFGRPVNNESRKIQEKNAAQRKKWKFIKFFVETTFL